LLSPKLTKDLFHLGDEDMAALAYSRCDRREN